MSLELLAPGERGKIVAVSHCGGCGGGCQGHGPQGDRHGHEQNAAPTKAERLGLGIGKMVEILKNDGHQLLLLVDEVHIAIDRSIAKNIQVKGCAA